MPSASDVARRHRSGVIGWEIWNEENGGWRFWEPKENPAAYGQLLCSTRTALMKVDPVVPVAFGGLFFPPLGGLVETAGGAKFLAHALQVGGTAMRRCSMRSRTTLTRPRSPLPRRRSVTVPGDRRCRSAACGPAPLPTRVDAVVEHRGRVADSFPRQRRHRAGSTLRLLPGQRHSETGVSSVGRAAPRARRPGLALPDGPVNGTASTARAPRRRRRYALECSGPGGRRVLAL